MSAGACKFPASASAHVSAWRVCLAVPHRGRTCIRVPPLCYLQRRRAVPESKKREAPTEKDSNTLERRATRKKQQKSNTSGFSEKRPQVNHASRQSCPYVLPRRFYVYYERCTNRDVSICVARCVQPKFPFVGRKRRGPCGSTWNERGAYPTTAIQENLSRIPGPVGAIVCLHKDKASRRLA